MSTSVPLATASDLHPLVLLAEELDENKVTPGVLGFLVFAVMGLAIWWLMRSMTGRMTSLKKESFAAEEDEENEKSGPADEGDRAGRGSKRSEAGDVRGSA